MTVRLLNFHCVINYNSILIGDGTCIVIDDCRILYKNLTSPNGFLYLGLIKSEVQDVNK